MEKETFDAAMEVAVTYAEVSQLVNQWVMEHHDEWAGLPMPLPGLKLTLDDRHPWKDRMTEFQDIIDSDHQNASVPVDDAPADVEVVNHWHSVEKHATIFILRSRTAGVVTWTINADGPLRNRLLLGPCETACVWPLDAELSAMQRLSTLITPHLFAMYTCTGQFLETSKRSGLTYLFRRLRPTVVLTGQGASSDQFTGEVTPGMRILTCLCLHPIAYYANSYCGAMVPTDDVIAHLLYMRADEHLYWRRANHHTAGSVLAGL